jgi:hypothetical protein
MNCEIKCELQIMKNETIVRPIGVQWFKENAQER